MTHEDDIDVAELEAQLTQIKDAMGIRERYPGQFHLWLVFGVLVPLASLTSQYVVLEDLPGYLHAVAWFGFMGLGGVYQWLTGRQTDGLPAGSTDAKPRIGLQFAAVFVLYFVFLFTLGPAVDALGDRAGSALLFGLIVGLVGVSYLIVGESLRAYYIRRKDRWAFYVGGAWMLVLAVLLPNVAFLETWGYAVFGVLYAVHAVGSYVVLSE